MAVIAVGESRIAAARAVLVAEAAARFPLATRDERDADPEPRLVRDTEFVTDADGKIIGKREVSRIVREADVATRPLLGFITADEMRAVSRAPYAVRTRPGAIAFDWEVVERALGRVPTPIDIRVLKVAAVAAGGGALGDRLDGLAATLDEVPAT